MTFLGPLLAWSSFGIKRLTDAQADGSQIGDHFRTLELKSSDKNKGVHHAAMLTEEELGDPTVVVGVNVALCVQRYELSEVPTNGSNST